MDAKRLALLFLVSLMFLTAAPVRATGTEYYALSFDGDDYITAQGISSNSLSVVVLFKATNLTGEHTILDARKWGDNFGGWNLRVENSQVKFLTAWNDSGTYREASVATGISANRIYLVAAVHDGSTSYLYLNGNLAGSVAVNGLTENAGTTLYIGENRAGSGFFEGTMYMVLIYNRTLSDSEISQIYSDPLNPPTNGLVLWYAPDSVDVENDKWLDKSGQGNDGQIYGAEPVRVSIPSLSVYDAVNGSLISPLNVSLSMLYNNTTTGLVPSLPVLPYNETVTLNVSATGYYERLITMWTSIDSLAVYLQPLPSNNTTTYTPPSEDDVPTAPSQDLEQPNDFGLWGSRLGAKFMAGNWSEAFTDFWTLNNLFAIVLPIIFSAGLIIMSWMVTRKPIVPIGVTAVLATFFGMIGVPLRLAVIGPLGGFFLFMLVWLGWDFYKRFERG